MVTKTTRSMNVATEHLEATIRSLVNKVAPVKIVQKDPRNPGDWYTDELQVRVATRNNNQRKRRGHGMEEAEEQAEKTCK